MSNLRLKLQALCFALLFGVIAASAQGEIRYVSLSGDNSNSGTSWAEPKRDIQDAINDLVNNNKTGEVWVQEGTYYPTEATETSGSQYYRAFKIPAGITVRGGFRGQIKDGSGTVTYAGETKASQREMVDDANYGKAGKPGTLDGEEAKSGKYAHQTILCGDIDKDKVGKLTFNKDQQQFDCTFYGNSYHVVWFAMNGFTNGRANPLAKPAKLEGCIVKGGHAYHRDVNAAHPHEAYGGGIYMVANSFVYNCEVHDCDASRNGGGIYMDGGGIVRRTYVHDCQALGLGTEFGMGGGICEDGAAHNSKANPIVVAQSVVTNCVGRLGGGVALLADQTKGNNKYAVVINSTVVNNNTAQVEAGGVYTYKGGGVASSTIVTNKCNGSGITQNGVLTGRAGGLYSRDAAYVGNTVIWGNECEANKNIQYAASRSSLSDNKKSKFYHNALSKADIADWSLAEKLNVMSLEDDNENPTGQKTNKGFPLFFKPTTKDKVDASGNKVTYNDEHGVEHTYQVPLAGYIENYSTKWERDDETGVWDPEAGYNWNVYSESALTNAGINTADLDHEGLTPAPTGKSYDMYFDTFNARPTIGAYVAEMVNIAPKETKDGSDKVIKEEYFVDPDYIYTKNNPGDNGANWTYPVRFLGNVLDHIAKGGKAAGEKEIIIYVKEGTVDNTRSANEDDRVRTTPLDIPSNVTILGSYADDLTDTDLSRRNPIHTPTIISAKLMDDYKYNVAHLINIDGKENITIDGFKLTFANANSTELTNDDKNGAAIMLKNCQKHADESEPNIHFKNITVSNCYGDKGTVVYAENASADFENCIFHNNTTATLDRSGLIYGIKSDLRFDHCDVVRNVGHASYLDAATHNTWTNSIFYGNMDRALTDTNVDAGGGIGYALEAFSGTTANASGSRCMFDSKSASFASQFGGATDLVEDDKTFKVGDTGNKWQYNLQYEFNDGAGQGYPRFINPTKNAGYTIDGNSTYYGRAVSYEPHNNNPVVNTAGTAGEPHSARQWGKDITTIITRDFGGLPDIGAVESHIATVNDEAYENANHDGQMPYGIAYYVRDYAQPGMPQTYTLNSSTGKYTEAADGKGNYVDENGTKIFLDGASWQYAVSGNANYARSEEQKTDVNTEWKATKTAVVETFKGFKFYNGTTYVTVNNQGTLTTATAANAAVWTVSDVTTKDGLAQGNHTISTVVNGTTYYLSISSTAVSAVTRTSGNTTITMTGSGYNYTLKTGTNNYLRLRNGGLQRSTTSTSWTFAPQTESTGGNWVEESVPSTGVTGGATVKNGDAVNITNNLHVYTSKDDITNLGTANVVTYKIKTASGDKYVYDNGGNTHYIRKSNEANAHKFALISTGKEDLYYLYDINTGRYLYNYGGTGNNPIRTDATNRSEWRIKNETNLVITAGTNDAQAWTIGDTYVKYANISSGTQLVLVAQNGYTNKTYTKSAVVEVNINGLQYAVNTVHDEYMSSGKKHEVHVAKGTYTNQSDINTESVSQPYAYMMKEGVDVLGGYPTVGNPGEDQRQPKMYETILQPSNKNPYVDMEFNRLSGSSGYSTMQIKAGSTYANSGWGAYVNSNDAQDAVSFARVLVQPNHFNVQTLWDGFTFQHGYLNTAYSEKISNALANLSPAEVRHSGGAGVLLQENGILENCVIRDNVILISPSQVSGGMIQTGKDTDKTVNDDHIYTFITGGAGVFMSAIMNSGDKTVKGKGGIVRNCQIYQNQLINKAHIRYHEQGTTYRPDNVWQFGGGLYQNGGDVFNTIVHDNFAVTLLGSDDATKRSTGGDKNNEMMLGAGVFVSQGNFYNNTIVNNIACTYFQNHDNHCTFGGVHVFEKATIYNSLIAGNAGHWSYEHWSSGTNPGNGVPVSAFKEDASDRFSRDKTKVHVKYSFLDVTYQRQETLKDADDTSHLVDYDLASWNDERSVPTLPDSDQKPTNIYLNFNPNISETKGNVDYDNKLNTLVYYAKGENKEYQLITATSPCVNTGTEDIYDPIAESYVVIPDVDAAYCDRVQDCRIDIGAYESDGSATIAPQTVGNQLVFYVTPEGYGTTSGSSPKDAACAPKLQKVIDAAGRTKLQYPDKQVIVKVANSYAMANPGTSEDQTNFTYYATRTTDAGDQDVRMWSIIVPRGVEVWGGYTDVARTDQTKASWTDDNNGFMDEARNDARNITKNPTYFDSYYYNKEQKSNATTYHVVSFTDRVYDVNGVPFLKNDIFNVDGSGKVTGLKGDVDLTTKLSTAGSSERDESLYAHMSDIIGTANVKTIGGNVVSNRAVLDGIFVTGGNANGATIAGSSNLNAHSYGGGAIVTDYAYVRNCIVMDNSATNGGGLALTNGALVSGSLIIENNADNSGGGLYVFENGATLSNGIKINSGAPSGQPMDYNMAHVITTTIAGNTAQHGGGVWYTSDPLAANARFNSVAIWQNEAPDQTNVFGAVNPEQPTEDETDSEIYYPFSYSVIQNVRASGTNNLSAENINSQGVRFVDKGSDVGTDALDQTNMAEEQSSTSLETKLSNFGYYGLTEYSILCSNGMPVRMYNALKTAIAISDVDILGTQRIDANNKFVEIGARALPFQMPKKQLMLRLFVADPGDVDKETAVRFLKLRKTASSASKEEYYSQIGSSFALPFNSLQDALDYVKMARDGEIITDNYDAQNLPFEILVGRGYHYPKKDLNGETISVWAHTFAIPEGVTIIGGFNPQGGGTNSYYGRYWEKKTTGFNTTDPGSIYNNVDTIKTAPYHHPATGANEIGRGYNYGEDAVTLPAIPAKGTEGQPGYVPEVSEKAITFQRWNIQDIADRRAMADNNKNGIIEPWEFANQTVISGNAVNGETDGVYHIMTAVADADAVGNLPKVQKKAANETEFTGYAKSIAGNPEDETGYQVMEQGQQIRLNGLVITGGNALTYLSTALDEYGKYIFYQGAGLQVDGNRYKKQIDAPSAAKTAPVFHNSAAYGIGYRDIPVSVTNCQFRNNVAGYGGAISTNGSLSIFASSFEQNMAIAQTEKPEPGETWTTDVDPDHKGQTVSMVMYPGQGGAIHATGQLSAFNTLFANNEARLADGETEEGVTTTVKHPTFRVPVKDNASATLRAAGGAIMMGSAAEHHIVNCDFVRNKANAYPAVFTMNPTRDLSHDSSVDTHNYSQIINTVAWGNEVNPTMLSKYGGSAEYKFASKLMVNVGKKDRTVNYIKNKTDDFYNPAFAGNAPASQEALDGATGNWQEGVWFCAYEDGVGFTPNNTNDLRTKINYVTGRFAPTMIMEANNNTYQNCNILIVANNDDIAGPNFGTPSFKAGYDGFMEGADWSPARFNRLTDNGNGWIKQTVDPATLNVTFNNDKSVADTYQGAYSVTHYSDQFPEYRLWTALGNEKYMQAAKGQTVSGLTINGTPLGDVQKNLPRISADPTVDVGTAYIDIGVYEYMKQSMALPGSEVDVLWVSTKEHPENGAANGLTWKTPTSDLQRAIENLLSSRNGHKKEIRIMEGEYTPVTLHTVGSDSKRYQAFYINTESLNNRVVTPAAMAEGANTQYYAQSLTIKGGYSSTIEHAYDPDKYKTVIRQAEAPKGVSTDHLLFIDDATLRYAWKDYKDPTDESKTKDAYNEDNNYGALKKDKNAEGDTEAAKTMPIQIDGVTLINDKAAATAKGAAIYYDDTASDISQASDITVGSTVTYYTTEAKTEVSQKETAFFTTKQYYSDENCTSPNNPNIPTAEHPEYAEETGYTMENPAKLVIAKTQVIGSGYPSETANSGSAVYVGVNGGSALIYNTVFHSNYGLPLDAYNTVNVNNTFGLNAGLVQLHDVTGIRASSMHNSALWKNNKSGATAGHNYGDQIHFGENAPVIATSDNFTYNSFTGCTNTGDPADANRHNTSLVDQNYDLASGPNFVDPENTDIEARSFDLKPSVRLLNKGNGTRTVTLDGEGNVTSESYGNDIYGNQVVNAPCKDGATAKTANYDYSLVPAVDKDAAYRTRIIGNGDQKTIDIGAYEYQGNLMRVLYVDPNKMHSADATGENWDKAFGYGDLQNAMDLAAIYHISTPNEEAYVFSKGASSTNKDLHTEESLIIRDGVTAYGSIVSSYTDWHGDKTYNGNIEQFIENMRSNREGVASNAASKTIVTSIKTDDGNYNGGYDGSTKKSKYPAVVDGFVVTPVDADHQPTAPVLDLTNTSKDAAIVVRNVIVADNDMSKASGTNVDVATVTNGLIYEVLMRDNKPKGANGAVLHVNNGANTKGYAVNVTVEGKTVGADGQIPVDGMNAAGTQNVEITTQIYKSITNSIGAGKGKAAGADAPYGAITNNHISGFFYNIADPNLNFQLTETSKYINACEAVNPLTTEAPNLAQFINYQTDRDILGNPRVLAGVNDGKIVTDDSEKTTFETGKYKLDRGAFETWKVQNTGNNFFCGSGGTISKNDDYKNTPEPEVKNFDLIKKHFYPHDGSVCYIMAGQSLIIDAFDPTHEVKPTPHNPGFMLVQEGANFYGNGRPATCAYVAIERKVRNGGSIVAVPYEMNYKMNVSQPKYDTNSYLTALTTNVLESAHEYDGGKRSDWKYIFQEKNTDCWTPLANSDVTDANHGVLLNANGSLFTAPDPDVTEVLLRFTGKGGHLTDYIYTEEGTSKNVTLTRYDDAESTNDGADYTDQLDMGWNCFGLPYLVSKYEPYKKVKVKSAQKNQVGIAESGGEYAMYIPHTLWLYYNGTTGPDDQKVNGNGGYYSVNSWENSNTAWHYAEADVNAVKSIWVGEGMFTQTAALTDTESLKFWLPVAPTMDAGGHAKSTVTSRYYYGATGIQEKEMSDDVELIGVEYYTTDGIRIEKPRRNTVVLIRKLYSNGAAKVSKQVVK